MSNIVHTLFSLREDSNPYFEQALISLDKYALYQVWFDFVK